MPMMVVPIFCDDEDGGFEVDVEFDVEPADPSVGIMSYYVSHFWLAGSCDETRALQARLDADPKETQRVLDYLNDRYDPSEDFED